MRRVVREPLLHFLLIGAALFLLFRWRGAPASTPGAQPGAPTVEIVVTREAVARAGDQFTKTWQRPPTDAELQALIDDLVRNEIFYREALAAGLDRDDEVLKRRLRQKMEFILEDVTAIAEPTDADLQAFLEGRRDMYLAEPQVSFRQVYFNPDRRGQAVEADARKALAQLAAGAAFGTFGDPTMLEPELPLLAIDDVRRRFGDGFAGALLGAPPGKWAGPVRSGYGLHLVRVAERREARLPALGEIREKVKRDWTVARQKELKDAAYAKIRERYTVTFEKPGAAAATASATPEGTVTR